MLKDLPNVLTEPDFLNGHILMGDVFRYQKWIYFLVCLPAALTAAVTMASVFTLHIPPHRCQVRYI